MEDRAAILGALIGLGALLIIGTLVGAIILRAAISLRNKLAGGPETRDAVPEPAIGKAMGITFVATLANLIAGSGVEQFVGGLAAPSSGEGGGWNVIAQLVSLPVGLLVMAGMLSSALPTTFVQAIGVTICHLMISVILGGILLAIVTIALG
ncbi:hypothetical protein AB1L88_22930 [Tautonia sp. JC769]|uniref:hypothetical protein n=1 Tax=Tautonia sp. JC769 TaxID=3232135 RepID=UPI003458DCA3